MKKIITSLYIILFIFSAQNSFSQTGLSINEVDYDQPATDTAEFIELYNSSLNAIDLGGYSIVLVNGNNTTPYDTIALPSQLLNPGSYFVICGSMNFVPNSNLVLSVPSNIIQNGSPDAIAIVDNVSSAIIDVVSYEGSVTGYFETAGMPAGANSDTLVPFTGIGRFPDGHDTNDNSADFHLACITPGTANVNANTNCSQPLNVRSIDNIKPFNIYPNPSRGISIIDFKGSVLRNASLTLNNLLGKEIKKIALKGSETAFQIDLSEYPDGVYFVKLKSDNGESTHRIILRK